MTKPKPYIQNKNGRWIERSTGKFAKKSDYLPYLERKVKADSSRSSAVKEYWADVKKFQEMGYDIKQARNFVHNSPKYVEKRGKKIYRWDKFWQELKGKPKAQVKRKIKELEDDDFELITY